MVSAEALDEVIAEYRLWRMKVRNDFDAFLEYREMKRKADAYDEWASAGSVGPAEDRLGEGPPEDSRPQ